MTASPMLLSVVAHRFSLSLNFLSILLLYSAMSIAMCNSLSLKGLTI